MSKKIDIKNLTSKEIEEELKRVNYNSKYVKILKSTIYSLITIAAVAVLIATIMLPVLQVSSSSMSPVLDAGDIVVSVKTSKLKQGDIVAFYHGNKILVKRVIAGAGSWVSVDDDGNVYVDSMQLQEDYVSNLGLGESDVEYPYQVPDGHWFVLSDDRSNLIDSRKTEIGCISNENMVGKVILRVWPFK